MSEHDLAKLAREGIEAFNHADWDRIRELTAPEFVYEETGSGRRVEGVEDFIAALQGWRTGMPDVVGEVRRIAVDGQDVAVEVFWTGTHTGDLPGPNGTLPATGKSVAVWSSFWQRVDSEGRLVAERNHADLLGMLVQLGVLG